jgi:putative ABC transport system permease protein
MIQNYLLTAWRHLSANKLFAVINVFGLAVGIMSCVLILMFVRDELSYDKWLADADRIVRLHTGFYMPDRPPFLSVNAAGRMMEAVRDYAPDLVENGVRVVEDRVTILKDDKVFSEDIVYADPSFFSIFKLPFRYGSADMSFNQATHVVISERAAIRYFGRTDVLGEQFSICCEGDEPTVLQVSGVMKNLPENSHMAFEAVVYMEPSMFDHAPNILNTWTSVNTFTYFKLKQNSTPAELEERIRYWLDNESPIKEMVDEGVTPSDLVKLRFMAVPDLHLYATKHSGNMGDFKPLGDIDLVYAFVAIAALVLIIASINFMNLSTARASQRAREVALRKLMGASRNQVAAQFLGEAVCIALFALIVALAAVEVVLPLYNDAIDKNLTMTIYEDPALALGMVLVTVLIGLLSGSYPAFYLSRYRPARTLKSTQSADTGQGRVRAMLVVFQFAVSIGLAVCTLVIYGQTLFAHNLDLGYDYDNKLVLSGMNQPAAASQVQTIVNELSRIEGVKEVVLSGEVPSQDYENNTGFRLLDPPEGADSEGKILNYYRVGFGFFEAYDMKMAAGRPFDPRFGSDEVTPVPYDDESVGESSVVINESAARQLGFVDAAAAIGHTLRGEAPGAGVQHLTIIGVAKDVYFRSIKFGVRPSVFVNYPNSFRVATISYDTEDTSRLVGNIEYVWKKLVPQTPVNLRFLNDMMFAQYRNEEGQAKLFAAFSLLAVVVACLGLYGLASFAAERRTREIGIRKVMGARIADIIRLLVWQFSTPVLVANLIAWPFAWYVMSDWLEGFSYRIDSGFILLASLIAGTGALAIAWLTVASRALKVASESPINALRYE